MPKYRDGENRSGRRSGPYDGDNKHKHRSRDRDRSDDRRKNRRRDDDLEPCSTFDDMKLKPDLLKGIYAYGFEKPSAIQQRAIRPIVRGRDVIAQSQSGTGKTAVFSISTLQLLDETSREVQALVLSPTRELAEQSQRVIQSLGDFMNVRGSSGSVCLWFARNGNALTLTIIAVLGQLPCLYWWKILRPRSEGAWKRWCASYIWNSWACIWFD